MYHYRGAGLDNVYLKNGYRQVMYGDETVVSVENVEGLHQAIAATLIQKPGSLMGQEFRFLRIEMGLTQQALGKLIRVSDQSVAAWEKEITQKVPGSAEILVRAFAREQLLHGKGQLSDFVEMLVNQEQKIPEEFCFQEFNSGWKEAA